MGQRHIRVEGNPGIERVPWRRQRVLQGMACQVRECVRAGQEGDKGDPQVPGGKGGGMDHGE
eukprot:8177535-Alexandrium_andersonii.AAC.1